MTMSVLKKCWSSLSQRSSLEDIALNALISSLFFEEKVKLRCTKKRKTLCFRYDTHKYKCKLVHHLHTTARREKFPSAELSLRREPATAAQPAPKMESVDEETKKLEESCR